MDVQKNMVMEEPAYTLRLAGCDEARAITWRDLRHKDIGTEWSVSNAGCGYVHTSVACATLVYRCDLVAVLAVTLDVADRPESAELIGFRFAD